MSGRSSGGGNRRRGGSGRAPSRSGGGKRRRPAGAGQRGTTPVREPGGASGGGGSKKDVSLGGEQVEGRHAVRELLLAGSRRTREVILSGDLDSAPIIDDIIDLADEHKVTVRELSRGRFDSMTRTEGAQGVVAMAAPIRPVDLSELLVDDIDGTKPFLMVLDGITDPGNLGAILRTAECAGVSGVVLPRHRAAHITPTVSKAAAGAIEHLRMSVVGGLPSAMSTMREAGVWTVGLDAGGDRVIHDLPVADEPVALVLGAEGPGLSRLVRARCDTVVSIPLQGVLDSLNVSAAAAVACFEVTRRRSSSP